jgi:hypothetical protein
MDSNLIIEILHIFWLFFWVDVINKISKIRKKGNNLIYVKIVHVLQLYILWLLMKTTSKWKNIY